MTDEYSLAQAQATGANGAMPEYVIIGGPNAGGDGYSVTYAPENGHPGTIIANAPMPTGGAGGAGDGVQQNGNYIAGGSNGMGSGIPNGNVVGGQNGLGGGNGMNNGASGAGIN